MVFNSHFIFSAVYCMRRWLQMVAKKKTSKCENSILNHPNSVALSKQTPLVTEN